MYRLFFVFLLSVLLGCTPEKENTGSETAASTEQPDVEQRLAALGIELPEVSAPVANYVNAVRSGNLLFLAGKGPRKSDGSYITGRVTEELTLSEAQEAARLTAINQLAVLKAELGDLNKVKRIVKVNGMVNSPPGFGNQPEVINGFSDLMVEVFGERGKHARAAVGMSSLPRNIAVEVEMIVEVEE
ncbi:RidA family protein [Balneolaceae bacterium YR4-1]|uniref:RidA family protein n=1 Tax=Halalkalibaculum roseum TaxID=2709311 RepID=A0A6M1TCB9_9BACT|nr:RidA family protein [Halalkalibaculum roseum]NGP77763.1 RidA family protein [Halalkalibaculum roseum]